MLLPPRRNPFRWSTGKLCLATAGLTLTALLTTMAGCGDSYAAVAFLLALACGAILTWRVYCALIVANESRNGPPRRVDLYAHPATTRFGERPQPLQTGQPPQVTRLTRRLTLYQASMTPDLTSDLDDTSDPGDPAA